MSPKPPAEDEIRRVLAMIPWIRANPGRTREEIADHFGVSADRVDADVRRILLIGAPPFSPADYVEVHEDDAGGIEVHLAEAFRRPLRLHPAEALHVLAAGRALLAVPGAVAGGPLASALAKIELALGAPGPDVAIEDELALESVREAVMDRIRIEIDYVAGNGEATTRLVDPGRIFYNDGEWYLAAYCYRAADERIFRVDRIRAVRPTGDPVDEIDVSVPDAPFRPGPDTERVTLRIPPDAQWLVESIPTESVTDRPDGHIEVVLAVADPSWLERVLLRVGPGAVVVDPPHRIDCGREAATRILARYTEG